jgi:3-hydroxyacyl-CoA dehydrogenase/enoyl-CoA hydratase/3-hydroxybutyryl-CoA epimerase
MDWPGQEVNTMGQEFAPALAAMLDQIEAERDQVAGVILASAKKTFFAGGDLKWLMSVVPADAPAVFAAIEQIKAQLRRLEKLGKPVVAAIAGAALGGGWELALACHHRVVLDDPAIQLGQPEVTLGLLPGGGGIVRMVRHLGLQAAMPFLAEGKLMRPAEAAQLGLAELAPDRDALLVQARAWIAANPAPEQPWDRKGYKLPGGAPSSPHMAQLLTAAPAVLVDKTQGAYPAPKAILSAAVEGAQVPFEVATRIESRYFVELVTGQVAKNMIGTFFFQLNEVKAGASRPRDVPRWRASRVGVLGAGMMGSGIAYATAARGIPVVLKDTTVEQAERGKSYSAKVTARRVERGQLSPAAQQELLDRIRPTADAADLAGCDLIIEAVFERTELKHQVIRETEPLLAAGGIFASNTSTLPISGLAGAAERPESFVGLHFFSPVDKMQLVEIVKGRRTSAETLARAYDYVQQIGKIPIVVNDSRGFFTSRVIRTFLNEAAAMLSEGVPPAAIERAALLAGFPTGPLALLDEVSLKLAVSIADEARQAAVAAGQPAEDAPGEAVIRRMVAELGRPGKAGGAGFYDYPGDGGKKQLWPGLSAFAGGAAPITSTMDVGELKDRLLYVQSIETLRCLEEGVLESARDANIGSIFGIGFPGWTGGAIQFVNHVGVRAFAARAEELARAHGPRFAPPRLLREHAEHAELFQ